MAVDPIIKQKADDIRHKIYGKEVRESLASGIEAISEDVEATISRQDYVEEQFQNVIDETTDKDVISAPELIAARNGKSNLKTRLDDEHAQVTAQLAQKANDSQVRKKSNPITLNDLDGETLGIIQDGSGGTPIDIESVPRDGSVTPVKTDFLNIYKDLFDFNKHIAQAIISSNTDIDYIYPPSAQNAKIFYVPVEGGKSYTVRAKSEGVTDFNTFNLAFSNDTEINTPIVRVFDRNPNGGAIDVIEKSVTNVGNHKYLLIRADNSSSYEVTSKIEVFEGYNILEKEKTVVIDGAEVALKDDVKDELSNYKLSQKSVTPKMTTFLEVSENLYDKGRFIEKATIQIQALMNYIFPSSYLEAKLFYVPIENNETYTIRVEETPRFDVFSVALSNDIVINAPIEIIKHVYNESGGAIEPVETQSFTFNNTNNYKYLLIRADNGKYDVVPPIHVYKGSEVPTTPTTVKINNHNLALLEDLPKSEDLETSRYKTYYELPEIIKAPKTAPSHQEIYGLYDELVSNKTRYNVEMTVLGTDGQGNELRSYKFSRPAMINDYGFERIKVGIMSGLHGGERYPVYALHQFMKDLSENEHNNEVFDRIMTNVDFYIIPIGNPSGWDNNTRQNWNGVNLNRNFDAQWETTPDMDKGSSPASEEETQLIQNWMLDNELDYFTDFHVADMGTHEDAYTASWFATENDDEESARAYYRTLNLMTNIYANKYAELPNDLIYGHVKKGGNLSQSRKFASANGIKGSLLEISEYIKWFVGDIYKVGINWSTEMVGNLIIELTRKHLY